MMGIGSMYKICKLTIVLILGLFGLFLNAFAENTLRDPTQPPFINTLATDAKTATATENEIKIDAIFSGKKHSSVIIGNHTYTVGDKILDATILTIDSHGIKLKDEDGEFEVTMPYSAVKSPITTNKKKNHDENKD